MERSIGIVRLVFLGALAFSSPAFAQPSLTNFHVVAQPIADALIAFAVQAHVSIGVAGIDFHGARGNAVEGAYSSQDALSRILEGSGYTFEFLDANTVRIRAIVRQTQQVAPVENVIVTATKREAEAQTLPFSIVVLTGDTIDDSNIRNTHGLQHQVAGLTETNLGPGQDKLFVRGLTDSVLPGVSESIVGMYLDESRITDDAPAPELRLVDIERVEVLRGPQGSLYGAGSLTGLVRVITRKPAYDAYDAAASVSVSLTDGGGSSASMEAMLNLPLVANKLALRAVAYSQTVGGYVDDIRIGQPNTNRTTIGGGRLALGWAPDAAWDVMANLVVQHIDARDSQYFLLDLSPQDRDLYLREPHSDQLVQTGLTASARLGWADLVTSSSILDRRIEAKYDASFAWHDLTGFPQGAAPFDYARRILSFTHETRLASPDDQRFKWLVGVYASHRDETFRSTLTGPDALADSVLARMEQRDDSADEYAAFADASYDITPSLSVGAGLRVFHAWHKVDADVAGFLSGPPEAFDDSTSQSGVMPKLVLSYRTNSGTTLYAQYSQGYRLGGLNVDGPPDATGERDHDFDSDLLSNYEVGTKLSVFEDRVRINLAAYYVLWKNVQTDQVGSDGTFFILNAGDVRDYGLEADVSLQPLDGLRFGIHAFWNKAKLSNSDPRLDAEEGVLPGAPSFGFSLVGRYEWAIDDTNTAFVAADYGYVGESHLGFNEETPQMGSYEIANTQVGVQHDNWRLTIFVDNVMDAKGNTFAFGNPFHPGDSKQATTPSPRVAGVSLSWAY